jgi:glycosyltransferase involved in cell wall biosynthesis
MVAHDVTSLHPGETGAGMKRLLRTGGLAIRKSVRWCSRPLGDTPESGLPASEQRVGTLNEPAHIDRSIFFFSTLRTPFIRHDEALLAERYRVTPLIAKGAAALLRIPVELLRHRMLFVWFGSVYAGYAVFLAKHLGRKSVVVVGGVDAAKEPDIRYGIWLNPWKSRFVRYAFRNADRLLVVDPFLQQEVIRLARYEGSNILYVPTGYDPAVWRPGTVKEELVLTVAACHDRWRIKKKGVDKVFEAAREMPGARFRLIGLQQQLLSEIRPTVPPNVEVIPYVPQQQLLSHYQQAKVYCQPSYTEGLPNSLCEAMLCGCIPVGTIAGGIPTAIGDAGYLVEYADQDGLVSALRQALASPESVGLKARERVAQEFTVQRRRQALYTVIDELIG